MAKKILVVDDEPNIVEVVKSRLESEGYLVATACDGEQALAQVKAEKPDLVIMDVNMPKLSGYEVCNALQLDANYMNIPVVLLTACNQAQDIKKGMEMGAVSYISKPFKSIVLLSIVKGLIG